VPIPRTLAQELGVHLASRRPQPDDFVFTAPGGGPLRHHNFYRRHFKPAVAAAGLSTPVRFHDLRHTCAALLINADPPAHPLAVMKRLGHSSITVTYNTYGHLFPALEEALTEIHGPELPRGAGLRRTALTRPATCAHARWRGGRPARLIACRPKPSSSGDQSGSLDWPSSKRSTRR
jgi:hypothetical protein